MNGPEKSDCTDSLRRLEWSVRALAQEADVQASLFPGFVIAADELALDFEEYLDCVRREEISFNPDEDEALELLDRQLESMSGPEHEELWTDEALQGAREWIETRRLAMQVLERMDWCTDPPPVDRAIYVGPDT